MSNDSLRHRLDRIKQRARSLRDANATRDAVGELVRSGVVSRASELANVPDERPRRSERFLTLDDFKTAPKSLAEAVPGEEIRFGGKTLWRLRQVGVEIDPDAEAEAKLLASLRRWPDSATAVAFDLNTGSDIRRGSPGSNEVDPADILFFDLETTGLVGNAYMFLSGIMYLQDGRLVSEQLFARDYAEEETVVAYTADMLHRFGTVVTYNGLSFDLPFVAARCGYHRLQPAPTGLSLDLLHAARKAFQGILPNRRLVTVEKHLRGVGRDGDIPSRYIPEAYHDFVHSQDAQLMENATYHNCMDVFTMVVILNRLASGEPLGVTEGALQPPGDPHLQLQDKKPPLAEPSPVQPHSVHEKVLDRLRRRLRRWR